MADQTLLGQAFPNVVVMAAVATHSDGSVIERGCDDQFEFEFALDLLLDGISVLHSARWEPPRN